MADAQSQTRIDTPDVSAPPTDGAPSTSVSGVGARVGAGLAWTLVSNLLGKGAGIAMTVILGYLLTQEQMGVWSTTLGVYAVMLALRDGGLGTLLVQKGEREYDNLIGPIFWLSAALHLLGALVLATLAPIYAAQQPDKEGLLGTMLLCALALLLLSPSAAALARLRMQLRFARIAAITLCSALARAIVVIGCARAGLGPMSFGAGLVAVAIFEPVAMLISTREALWAHSPQIKRWPELLYAVRWNIALAIATSLVAAGDSLVLAPIVDAKVLGIYYFAMSLVLQIEQTVAGSASQVLFPAFAQFKDDQERLGEAMLRTCQALMLIGAPMTLGMGILADPLIRFVWSNHRWDDSIPCLTILCMLFGFRIIFISPTSVLLAQGRFKRVFACMFTVGIAVPIAAAIGAILWKTPLAIALCAGAVLGPAYLAVALWIGKSVGVQRRRMLGSLIPVWFAALVCAGVVWSLDKYVLQGVYGFGTGVKTTRIYEFVRLLVGGLCFASLYAIIIRFALTHALTDGLSITPQRIRGPIQRLLRLSPASA